MTKKLMCIKCSKRPAKTNRKRCQECLDYQSRMNSFHKRRKTEEQPERFQPDLGKGWIGASKEV